MGNSTSYGIPSSILPAETAPNLAMATASAPVTKSPFLPSGNNPATSTAAATFRYVPLEGSVVGGYQGWFDTPCRSSPQSSPARWRHWTRGLDAPSVETAHFDIVPDASIYPPTSRCPTNVTDASGRTLDLFSSADPAVADVHLSLLAGAGMDGVFLQRFLAGMGTEGKREFRDAAASAVRGASAARGVAYAVMYDISGYGEAEGETLAEAVTGDWVHMERKGLVPVVGAEASTVGEGRVDGGDGADGRYVHLSYGGRPCVAIWGFGVKGRNWTAGDAIELIDFFHGRGYAVVGGVPPIYRNMTTNSSTADPDWGDAFARFDVISPWTVGTYNDTASADVHAANYTVPDIASSRKTGQGYLPVIFPGFSWHNLQREDNGKLHIPPNHIPRMGGRFLYHQGLLGVDAGASMFYVAMVDEYDEGTALLPMVPSDAYLPVGTAPHVNGAECVAINGNRTACFVPRDADDGPEDGAMPGDWYLILAGTHIKKAMRRGPPITDWEMPPFADAAASLPVSPPPSSLSRGRVFFWQDKFDGAVTEKE